MKRWMSVALVLALLLGGAPAPALAQQSVSATELLGHGWWLVTQMVTGDNVIIDDSDPSNPRIIIPPGGSYNGPDIPMARMIAVSPYTDDWTNARIYFDYTNYNGAGVGPFAYNPEPEFLRSLYRPDAPVVVPDHLRAVTGNSGMDTQPRVTHGNEIKPHIDPTQFWHVNLEKRYVQQKEARGETPNKAVEEALKQIPEGLFVPGELDLTLFLRPKENGWYQATRWVYTFFIDGEVFVNPPTHPQEGEPVHLQDDVVLIEFLRLPNDPSETAVEIRFLRSSLLYNDLLGNPDPTYKQSLTVRVAPNANGELKTEKGRTINCSGSVCTLYIPSGAQISPGIIDTFWYTVAEFPNAPKAQVSVRVDSVMRDGYFVDDEVTVPAGKSTPINVLANDIVPKVTVRDGLTLQEIGFGTTTFEPILLYPSTDETDKGRIQVVNNQLIYTPKPGVKNTTDSFYYYGAIRYVFNDGSVPVQYQDVGRARVTVHIGDEDTPPDIPPPPLPTDQIGLFNPVPVCELMLQQYDYTEDLTRLIPLGDGRYQFITRSDRGSTANFKVFVASEEIDITRSAFRNLNSDLADFLSKAANLTPRTPAMTTDFLSFLKAGGVIDLDKIRLLMEQVEDIRRIMREVQNKPSELAKLNTTAGKVQFWTERGIYDKYTPKEIQFMNAVSFSLAMATDINGLILGSALSEGSAQMSLPTTAKTLSLITVLENPGALAQIWSKVMSGQTVSAQELAMQLTSRDTILHAASSAGIPSTHLRLAVEAASGSSNPDATIQILAEKLKQPLTLNQNVANQYLTTMRRLWGIPEFVGELSAEEYREAMQIINEMICAGGQPTSIWNIQHRLTE